MVAFGTTTTGIMKRQYIVEHAQHWLSLISLSNDSQQGIFAQSNIVSRPNINIASVEAGVHSCLLKVAGNNCMRKEGRFGCGCLGSAQGGEVEFTPMCKRV